MSNTRIYLVEGPGPEDETLVRAATKAAAVNHRIGSLISARVAAQDDLVAAMARGVKVEDAGSDNA